MNVAVVQRIAHLMCILLFTASCSMLSSPAEPSQVPTVTELSVAETPTLEPIPSLDAEFRSTDGGFSLRYPKAWATGEENGTFTLAASQDQLSSSVPGPRLILKIDSVPLELLAEQYGENEVKELERFFGVSVAGIRSNSITIGEPSEVAVGDQSGLAADLVSESLRGRIVAVLAPYQGVRILAQSTPQAWEQQSELLDQILASMSFFAPPPPPTPTPSPDQAVQPELVKAADVQDSQDEGFVLRLGGSSGAKNSRFASARGLALGPDGTIYLAESSQGVWAFESDGSFVKAFGKTELLDAYDVAVAANGDIYVADFGRNAVARFSSDGSYLGRWGETGDQPGQFGLLAPQRIAIASDNTIYALDSRVQPDNTTISRVLQFKAEDGSFIREISLPSGSSPNDLTIDGEGNLYLAETFGGVVLKLDKEGNLLSRLGDQAVPQGITAGALDIDPQGNVYVATWGSGILQIAPTGALLASGGTSVREGNVPKPGEFSLPSGIVVTPNGTIWVSDNSGEYSAITALRLVNDALADPTAQALATAAAIANATPTPVRSPGQSWVASASASSEYDLDYSISNIIGPPNVSGGCVSGGGSWASADPNGVETVEVRFTEPLFATTINIYQNHQPGFITQIDLIDERGTSTQVYSATAQLSPTCPLVLTVPVSQTLFRVVGAKLTLDQSSGASWSEIDAIELVGFK